MLERSRRFWVQIKINAVQQNETRIKKCCNVQKIMYQQRPGRGGRLLFQYNLFISFQNLMCKEHGKNKKYQK